VGKAGTAVVSDLVKVSGLSFDMLRRSQDPILRYTSDRLVDMIQQTPCVLQNQRATDA
jgi:hypothetical protein